MCERCNRRKVAVQGLCRRCYDERSDKRSYVQGSLHERLDHYTDTTPHGEHGCWLWTGTQDGRGYGLVWDAQQGRNRYAHVVAFERVHGRVPADRVVRHFVCDTPLCVKHSHLLLGTHADNVADMVSKQRNSRGSGHGMSKLTEAQVRTIRQMVSGGEYTQRETAYMYGVSQAAINLIVNRKTWTHI